MVTNTSQCVQRCEDSHFPMGTTQYEKRGISPVVPIWIAENCIQCNQCAYVCPHAVIRPFLLTEEEANNAPETATVLDGMKPYDNYKFRIQLSPLDCTGCASCVQTCPAKEKALVLKPFEENVNEVDNWNYMINLPRKENPMKKTMVKGSQFEFPYLEFSELVQAVVRHLTLNWSPSCLVIVCRFLMRPVVHPSGRFCSV